jgi:glucosylceramidase
MPTGMTVHVFRTSRNAGSGGMPEHTSDAGTLTVGGAAPSGKTMVNVDLTQPRQTIVGFGAALTEAVATVMNALPMAQQQQIFSAYWNTGPNGGSNYTMARTHIGSCDFAMSEYSYDDNGQTGGDGAQPDPNLNNFSIDHDKQLLIPLIKTVLAQTGGNLKILASPWSAPGWMKDNNKMIGGNGNGDGSLQTQYYGTYANYLSKYIQAYKAEGIPIWGITPQNEAVGVGGTREGMQWTSDQMNTFLKQNLGPQFMKDGIGDTKVFVFDHNKGPAGSPTVTWPTQMIQDTATNPFIAGTAVHWYGSTYLTYDDAMDTIHNLDTSKGILFTEGCADGLGDVGYGNSSPSFKYSWMSDDYYWQKTEGDWGFWFLTPSTGQMDHPKYEPMYRYMRDIIAGLNHWYLGFIDWNAVLNKDGGPGHIPNAVSAPVMVDPGANSVYFTPLFYGMQQISRFILPNAQVLATTVTLASGVSNMGEDGMPTQDGNALMATAAKNTDNSVSIVLFNETNASIDYAVSLGMNSVTGTIPAQSVETLAWQ